VSGRPQAGFSLVEVLIALAIGAWLLAGAWGWLWSATRASAAAADAVEAHTSLAFARRVLLADLRAAAGLSPVAPSGTRSFTLVVSRRRQEDGIVRIVWDPSRGVLWRVAPSCHLADSVEAFAVSYVDAAGARIPCDGTLDASRAAAVRGLTIDLRVRVGNAVVRGHWPIRLPAPGAI
jgi:prepilin-type N-terminal cleavage/methylation domain-containing protein